MLRIVSFVLAGAWLAVSPALAQEGVLSELYGSGVHAYFSGQPIEAYNSLNSAIGGGSSDPRCYYFRGLAQMQLGRPSEARADFAKGAALEYGDVAGIYHVDKALERVQGNARLTLERYRAAARTSGGVRTTLERVQRVQRVDSAQGEVLSVPAGPRPSPPGELPLPEANPMPPPANDGFGQAPPEAGAAAPVRATPPGASPFEERTPFGDAPPPSRPAANSTAQPVSPPTRPPAVAAKPAAPADDPFAPPKPATPPANPPAGNPPPAGNTAGEAKPGAASALGSALRKALEGMVPSVPTPKVELPFGLGGAPQPGNNQGNNNQGNN